MVNYQFNKYMKTEFIHVRRKDGRRRNQRRSAFEGTPALNLLSADVEAQVRFGSIVFSNESRGGCSDPQHSRLPTGACVLCVLVSALDGVSWTERRG
jgi:hypothetical protein